MFDDLFTDFDASDISAIQARYGALLEFYRDFYHGLRSIYRAAPRPPG